MSQLELATDMGCSQQMISRLEHGHATTSAKSLLAAARALRVSADYLVGLTDDPTPAADRRGVTAHAPDSRLAGQVRPSAAGGSPVEGVAPVRDRRLAELLAAVVRHWEALESRYARDTWLADVYRWCPALSAQRSARRSRGSAGAS